jgi:hypothetical protein
LAKVILVGDDSALLEGLAQTLLGFDHEVWFAGSVTEMPAADGPALVVISAKAITEISSGASLPLLPSSTLIVYGASHEEKPFLPARVQRATLAYLVLPLERHRLLALAQSFDHRSRRAGTVEREELDEDSELRL